MNCWTVSHMVLWQCDLSVRVSQGTTKLCRNWHSLLIIFSAIRAAGCAHLAPSSLFYQHQSVSWRSTTLQYGTVWAPDASRATANRHSLSYCPRAPNAPSYHLPHTTVGESGRGEIASTELHLFFYIKVLLLIKFVHMFDQKGLENCTCYQFLGYFLVKGVKGGINLLSGYSR